MGLGCFGLLEKGGKKGRNTAGTKINYPRVEKPLKDPQERIDQSVEDITLQTALNDLKENEQPVSKDSGIETGDLGYDEFVEELEEKIEHRKSDLEPEDEDIKNLKTYFNVDGPELPPKTTGPDGRTGSIKKRTTIPSDSSSVVDSPGKPGTPKLPEKVPEIYLKNKPNTLDRKKGQAVNSVNSDITQDLMENVNAKTWTEQNGSTPMISTAASLLDEPVNIPDVFQTDDEPPYLKPSNAPSPTPSSHSKVSSVSSVKPQKPARSKNSGNDKHLNEDVKMRFASSKNIFFGSQSTIGLRSETPLGRQVLNSLSESKSFPRESLILFESDLASDAFEANPDEKPCDENFHNHSKC